MNPSEQPLVTILMPAYNGQATIGASLTGALTQTYPNIEILVVDDGSTDRTAQIVQAYGDLVRYVHKENGGSASARNVAFEHARGELLVQCDSDDVLMPTYVETMVRTWQQAGGGRRFVSSNAMILTDAGTGHGRELIGKKWPAPQRHRLAILQRNFISCFALFPREMVEELGGYATNIAYNEDWDFWLRALMHGWEVVYQPEPLAEYRWTDSSKSTQTEKIAVAVEEIMRRAAQMPQLTAEEREYLELRRQHEGPTQLLQQATGAVRTGDYATAKEKFALVARLNSADRRMATRATLVSKVPGALPLWRLRLRQIDRSMGRLEGDKR